MSSGRSGMSHFASGGMTPRAWRMISYSCIGFLLYGGVILSEMMQEVRLKKVDDQLKMSSLYEIEDNAQVVPDKSTDTTENPG